MTATNPRDRETVLRLLRQHLPSGFPQELGPLDINGVACTIYSRWDSGHLDLLRTDGAINERLIGNRTPLPVDLSDCSIQDVLAAAGATEEATAIAPYWPLFKEIALEMIESRGRR